MLAAIDVVAGRGFVYDADVALWLRETCGVVGAMVGGVAEYKQQNAVRGLPFELMPEEVTLCLKRGWGVLRRASAGGPPRLLPADGDAPPPGTPLPAKRPKTAAAGPRRWQAALARGASLAVPMSLEDARTANEEVEGEAGEGDGGGDGEGGPGSAAGSAGGGGIGSGGGSGDGSGRDARGGGAERGAEGGVGGAGAGTDMSGDEKTGGENGAAEGVDAPSPGAGGAGSAAPGSAPAALAPPPAPAPAAPHPVPACWGFPSTRAEEARQAIFEDLHARGFRITGGSKFGADYLLYPGDPTLFHAQFGVRCVPPDEPLLPVLLAGTARGTHQARKHLLIASYRRGEGEKEGAVSYITLGPVDGFG